MVLSLCGGFQPRGGISGPGLAGSAPGVAANCSSTIGARDDEWPRKNSGPPELSRPRSSQRSWKSHLYSHAMARSSRSASPSCALTGSARAHALRRIFGGNWIRKCLTSSRSSLSSRLIAVSRRVSRPVQRMARLRCLSVLALGRNGCGVGLLVPLRRPKRGGVLGRRQPSIRPQVPALRLRPMCALV